MSFSYDWKVRFGDVDRAGIVYYPVIFVQTSNAVEDLMEDVGFPLNEIHDDEMGMPIVHAEADYYRPMTYGDTVEIKVAPDVGEASIAFEAVGISDGETAFEAQEQHVFVDMDRFESTAVPDRLREALGRYGEPRS